MEHFNKKTNEMSNFRREGKISYSSEQALMNFSCFVQLNIFGLSVLVYQRRSQSILITIIVAQFEFHHHHNGA